MLSRRADGQAPAGFGRRPRFNFWLTFLKNPSIMPLGVFLVFQSSAIPRLCYFLFYIWFILLLLVKKQDSHTIKIFIYISATNAYRKIGCT